MSFEQKNSFIKLINIPTHDEYDIPIQVFKGGVLVDHHNQPNYISQLFNETNINGLIINKPWSEKFDELKEGDVAYVINIDDLERVEQTASGDIVDISQ
ncbi:hypothetical protein BN7_1551 [Wickerhamomyces ciferrii]|uniref:Uncharacterized protein n=1 Tax=Wickerhamomyces ciferrii (strain ATCC 14091 / BCRC 22168 / CBS 111 / JCM 3599 / NBRC 0793 / NRRL Y-1031 F-60-10) TaxID=1206466 RepID=K0KIK5_WICCF|nr:uncharacterized protein BN7_1551 [Wickerhamomyces ciferrii]CCH42012.1 hypothetical protein BN7_1551 [Wickerhamomyces ciferrii]